MRRKGIILGLVLLVSAAALATGQPGNIDIRSTLVGTRVYLDDAYVGDADLFIEDVPPGEHIIILRQGSQRIRGEFTLKPGELLMVEGRFEESRIVDLRQIAKEEAEKRAEAARKEEAERKAAEAELKKQEQLAQKKGREEKKKTEKKAEERKPVVAVAKPAKTAEEDRQTQHLNIIRVDFEEAGSVDVKVTPRVNQKIVTNFNDSSSSTGNIYRSKQNLLLCEGGDCSRDWTGRFFYFDDTGKRDAFLLRWRETVFTGITPEGTSKVEVDLCVNGDCKRSSYSGGSGASVQTMVDRYVLNFNRSVLTVRRSDLLKAITDAGRKPPDF
jgi:hypothetical protein